MLPLLAALTRPGDTVLDPFAGSGAIEVKRIDAALEIANTLSKSRNVMYVPSGGNMMMAMPSPGAGRAQPMA